jgi:hypothetical protein
MNDKLKSVYRFDGYWFDVFDMLVGIIKPKNAQQFSVWESRKKTTGHLLIVYGENLGDDWRQGYPLKRISAPEFEMNYRSRIKEHIIHGYNEFSKK